MKDRGRDWPEARGVFSTEGVAGTRLVAWINEEVRPGQEGTAISTIGYRWLGSLQSFRNGGFHLLHLLRILSLDYS